MQTETIQTRGHTTSEGLLNLSLNVGVPDADVQVTVRVSRPDDSAELKDWPAGYFESVPGSMPELARAPQGSFEERSSIE